MAALEEIFQLGNRFSPTHQAGQATGSDTLLQYSPSHRMAGDWKPEQFQGYDYQSNFTDTPTAGDQMLGGGTVGQQMGPQQMQPQMRMQPQMQQQMDMANQLRRRGNGQV